MRPTMAVDIVPAASAKQTFQKIGRLLVCCTTLPPLLYAIAKGPHMDVKENRLGFPIRRKARVVILVRLPGAQILTIPSDDRTIIE
jgi:hypothetical protein